MSYVDRLPRKPTIKTRCQYLSLKGVRCRKAATVEQEVHVPIAHRFFWCVGYFCEEHSDEEEE